MSRSVERVLEEAHLSGDLKLNGRKLKEFPSSDKYDLNDTVFADLSRNRFTEVPMEIMNFWCLEHLSIHHNTIKSIPDSVTYLQSIVFLDISHNQLTNLPSTVFHLPLEILLVSNNKLQSLPSELGYCKSLTELDISSNQINRLPPQLGLLTMLRCLNIRSNYLLEIPIELTYLKLTHLDISRNRIASLPTELKNMSSTLEILRLSDNPLMAPPAVICARGMVHVFKWLELRCSKQDKKQNGLQSDSKNNKWKYSDVAKIQTNGNHIDWSYLSIDPSTQIFPSNDDGKNCVRHQKNPASNLEPSGKNNRQNSFNNTLDSQSVLKVTQKNQINNDLGSNEKGHLQTYREYKESLRLQRTMDSVYKCTPKVQNTLSEANPISSDSKDSKVETPVLSRKVLPTREPKVSEVVLLQSSTNEVSRSKSRTKDIPFDKLQFTMRREYEKAKEEAELIKQLRLTIESRLKVVLPDDLTTALNDGVVLCHFANHILPQSVGSIHVPSPTVPKLTTARSRRNVDNFLEACRKIGVDEELLCNRDDIIEMKEDILPNVAVIVQNLLVKSENHIISSLEHDNESLAQPHVCASLSSSPMFEKLSTVLCLLIFFSVNLLLYMFPIPDW